MLTAPQHYFFNSNLPNKMGINNRSNAEFKTLVIRMLNDLNEDLKNIK